MTKNIGEQSMFPFTVDYSKALRGGLVSAKKEAPDFVPTPENNWEFNEEVAQVFDSHVKSSVPGYEDIHYLVAKMSQFFVGASESNIYDIGCSTARTIRELYKLHGNKHNVWFYGIDNSRAMVDEANKLTSNMVNVMIEHLEVQDDEYEIYEADYVCSVLALQFIPIKYRQKVLNKVYKGLNEGGAFVLVEKVHQSDSRLDDMFKQIHHDWKLEQGFTTEEIKKKEASIRGVMRPVTLTENMRMLREAGFKHRDITTFWRFGPFVGILATK
jgi:tRNA (cmo5U34)-methyltransferase